MFTIKNFREYLSIRSISIYNKRKQFYNSPIKEAKDLIPAIIKDIESIVKRTKEFIDWFKGINDGISLYITSKDKNENIVIMGNFSNELEEIASNIKKQKVNLIDKESRINYKLRIKKLLDEAYIKINNVTGYFVGLRKLEPAEELFINHSIKAIDYIKRSAFLRLTIAKDLINNINIENCTVNRKKVSIIIERIVTELFRLMNWIRADLYSHENGPLSETEELMLNKFNKLLPGTKNFSENDLDLILARLKTIDPVAIGKTTYKNMINDGRKVEQEEIIEKSINSFKRDILTKLSTVSKEFSKDLRYLNDLEREIKQLEIYGKAA